MASTSTDSFHDEGVELTDVPSRHVGLSQHAHNDKGVEENQSLLKPASGQNLIGESSAAEDDDNHEFHGQPLHEQCLILQQARRYLYMSHLFAQFSEISWQFCLTIFLAALTNYKSLLLVSTYGLTTGLAVTLLGSTAGSLVDQNNRLMVARGFIFVENFCVVTATFFCFLLLSHHNIGGNTTQNGSDGNSHDFGANNNASEDDNQTTAVLISDNDIPTDMTSISLIIGIHILGAAARVLDEGFLVAMERDWVVVMSRCVDTYSDEHEIETSVSSSANSRQWLSETNVAMKQIDLSCKVLAPFISGFLIAFVDNRAADAPPSSGYNNVYGDENTTSTTSAPALSHHADASQFRYASLVVGAINVLALLVEYHCTTIIYRSIPDLAILKSDKTDESDDNDKNNMSSSHDSSGRPKTCSGSILPESVQVYLRQETALPGIGLAMLYLNALTFDAIFTAYLVWRGMGMTTIGVWRGISAAIGLLGTLVYHWSIKHMTLEFTGLWSIIYEFLCLSLSYGSLFVEDSTVSLAMLIAGVCASRIGLWVFDIAVTQMMQEYVQDGVRGMVGGVQQSLNAFFNLLSYALGIVFPDPKDFFIYVAAGYGSVGVAMILYGFGTNYRKHGSPISSNCE